MNKNELEEALKQSDDFLNTFLENVSIEDFRYYISAMLKKNADDRFFHDT